MTEPDQTIGVRLTLTSAALIIAMLSVGIVSINALDTLKKSMSEIVDVYAKKVQLGEKIQQDLLKITRAEKNIIAAQTQAERDIHATSIERNHRNLIQRLDSIQTLTDRESKSTIDSFRQKISEYMAVNKKISESSRLNTKVRAKNLSTWSALKAFEKAEVALQNIIVVIDKTAEDYKEQAIQAQQKSVYGTQMQRGILSILLAESNMILSISAEEMREYANKIDFLQNDLLASQAELRRLNIEIGTINLDKFVSKWKSWTDIYSQVLGLTLLNSSARAVSLSNGDARQAFNLLEESLIEIVEFHENRFRESSAANDPTKQTRSNSTIKSSSRLLRSVVEYQRAEKNLALAPTQQAVDVNIQVISDIEIEIDRRFVQLQAELESGNENMGDLKKSKLAYNFYRAHVNQIRKLSEQNVSQRAFELLRTDGRQLADEAELQLDIIIEKNTLLGTEKVEQLAIIRDQRLLVSRMVPTILSIHRAEKSLILEQTEAGMDNFADAIDALQVDLQKKLNRFKASASSNELDSLIFFEQYWIKYSAFNEQIRVLSRLNSNNSAYEMSLGEGRQLSDQAEVLISGLIAEYELSNAMNRELGNRGYNENFFLILAALALSTFLGVIFSFFMIRNVLNVISDSTELNNRSQWTKTGQAEMSKVMVAGPALAELSNSIIISLAKYVGASIGVIYLADDENSFTQAGSFAYSQGKHVSQTIKSGEGTVGQAISDASTIVTSDLPDDYIQINSGLGAAVPRHLMVVPLKLQGRVTGAIEIGSFNPFTELQVEFVELVSDAIAIAVRAGQNQERLSNLFDESQTQSEELQAQQEELRNFNEELEDKTESLQQQKKEIEASNVSLKQAQTELEEQARELKMSNAYKSQFLANMSHELRTPLNSMLLLSKSLMSDRLGNLQDEQIEDAKIIYEGGQDLLNLINDIMDLSKVEAGMLRVNCEQVAIQSIKADLHGLFDRIADSKSLSFEINIEDNTPAFITTDEQRLEQILNNFLSNAFKFTETGSVVLQISLQRFGDDAGLNRLKDQDLLVFSVVDTGIGIALDKQCIIFEAFQQVDGTTSRHYGGTGLGLAISAELARLLGGEITVKSEAGAGSNFSFYLPLNAEGNENLKYPNSDAKQDSSFLKTGLVASTLQLQPSQYVLDDRNQIGEGDQNILIIEDDQDFAMMLMKTVRSSGYRCLVAADGRSGLYLATEFPLSGVLLDMGLPDIDGLAVIKQLKFQARTASVPIHVISGHDRKSEVNASGVTGYLQKPATKEEIKAAVHDMGRLYAKNMRYVLVVEGDLDHQHTIAALFRGFTIDFTFAANGEDAGEFMVTRQFDCVILDLNLPDMSGLDLLKKVSADGINVLPPIIIYTGRELTHAENVHLAALTGNIIVKDAQSPERLIDEVAMFLHSNAVKGQSETKRVSGMLHNDDILFRGRTILLVDDDMRNVYVLSRELQDLGLNVLMAENGQAALNKLRADSTIELVLMDVMMPVMDGYEAMRKIRAIEKFAELPIIALTAKAMPEDRHLCIDAGASEYLTKPINIDKLKSILRVWLFERIEFKN